MYTLYAYIRFSSFDLDTSSWKVDNVHLIAEQKFESQRIYVLSAYVRIYE